MSRRSIWHLATALSAILGAPTSATSQTVDRLIESSNLIHMGSFGIAAAPGNGFDYGGIAIAFNSANQSLYVVGHENDLLTAEIEIPALGGTARILQPLTDALNGQLRAIGDTERRIGGNLVYRDKLYVTGFVFYDAEGAQRRSHFSRPLALDSGEVAGPLRAGGLATGFYSGYMGLIPAAWQERLGGPALTGNCCLSIISRTSYGPAAFAFDPENIGKAEPLVYYTADRQTLGRYGATGSHPVFNGSTRITGIVFPESTSSVLFFGMTGVGNYCYGEAAECQDPSNVYKGEHAYPYRAYVWAYNAADLAAVKAGKRRPWQMIPYATWELPDLGDVSANFGVGGATYDPASGRIYVAEKFGDGTRPLIHVYEIR
jgi:hypothetical protein